MKIFFFLLLIVSTSILTAQNELFINGDELHIKNNETVFVAGDLHIAGSTGKMNEDAAATIEVTGDWYKDGATIEQNLDGKVRFSGTNPQQIVSAGNGDLTGANTYFTNFEVNNTSGLVYLNGCNVEVKNTLNFLNASRLRTAPASGLDGMAYTQYVYVSNSSPTAITGLTGPGTTQYIEGRLRQEVVAGNTYSLPVGIDLSVANNNQLATFTLNQGAGQIETAFTYDVGGSITPIVTCGTTIDCLPNHGIWTIHPISGLTLSGGAVNYDIILQPGNYGTNCTGVEYVVMKDGTYTGPNICGPNASFTFSAVPRYGFTSFSQFRIGSTSGSLPIELLSFTGKHLNDKNHLFWTTNLERNCDHFNIERSLNGQSFEYLTDIKAAGNTNAPTNYTLIDDKPFLPGTHYRLKMFDIDGTSHYSNIIYLASDPKLIVSVFPNPFTQSLTIQANNIKESMVFRLYDATGKLIFDKNWKANNNGLIDDTIDLSPIAIGTYFYKIITADENITGKLLKAE